MEVAMDHSYSTTVSDGLKKGASYCALRNKPRVGEWRVIFDANTTQKNML